MPSAKSLHPVTISGPAVVLPLAEYRTLLAEAGHLPTPKLSRAISAARTRFRKGRFVSWETLKRDLR